jgi:hypothetical protein
MHGDGDAVLMENKNTDLLAESGTRHGTQRETLYVQENVLICGESKHQLSNQTIH